MRILMVSTTSPSALKPRLISFAKALSAEGHEVRIIAATDYSWGRAKSELGDTHGHEAAVVQLRYDLTMLRVLRGACSVATRKASSETALYDDPDLRRAVHDACAAFHPDVVHVDRMRAYSLAPHSYPLVLDLTDPRGVNYGTPPGRSNLSRRGVLEQFRRSVDLRQARREEVELAKDHVVITASPTTASMLVEAGRRAELTGWVPNAVFHAPMPIVQLPLGRHHLVMSGNLAYPPNAEAIGRFINLVSNVRLRHPEAEASVVGAQPSRSIQRAVHSAGIGLFSDVQSVPETLHGIGATLAVSPQRLAFGFPNRVIDASLAGIPSALGAATVAMLPPEAARLFVDSGEVRAQVDELMVRPEIGRTQVTALREWILTCCAPKAVAVRLEQLYRRAGAQ